MTSGSKIRGYADPVATVPAGDEIVEKSLTYLNSAGIDDFLYHRFVPPEGLEP
jgi:hypothetical protein